MISKQVHTIDKDLKNLVLWSFLCFSYLQALLYPAGLLYNSQGGVVKNRRTFSSPPVIILLGTFAHNSG